MKFFTSIEFLRSIIITSIASVILGCLYKMAHALLVAIKRTVFIFYDVCLALHKRKNGSLRQRIPQLKKSCMSKPALNIFEGVIFTLIGAFFIILLYVTLDGVFRFYVFILFASLFILSKNTLGDGAAAVFNLIFTRVYSLLFISIYAILLPVFLLLCKCADIVRKLLSPIKKKILISTSKRLAKIKIKESKEIFIKISKSIIETENAT